MTKKTIISVLLIVCIIVLIFLSVYYFYYINYKYKIQNGSDFKHLDSIKIEKPFNLELIKIFPKDFYVLSIKARDINNDGKAEIVFKKDKNIYILDNNWNEKVHCFAGDSVNASEVIMIDDINGDGKLEITTTGGKDSIYDELRRKYDLGGGGGYENGYYFATVHSRSGNINPLFFDEMKKYASDAEKISDTDFKIPEKSWKKMDTEEYSLKVFDINCNLLSEYLILDNRITPYNLMNIDVNGKKTVIFEAWRGKKMKYILKDSKMVLVDDNDLINIIDKAIEVKNFPVDRSKMERMKIGRPVFVEDLNSDGKKEIIVFAKPPVSYNVDTTIFVFDYDDEKLIWKYTVDPSLAQEIADINNDGKKEIISAGTHTDPISVFGFK